MTLLAPNIATASVMWVGNVKALAEFNDWFVTLAKNNTESLTGYVDWLWPKGCCHPPERGGLFCNAKGHTGCLRPYAVNEMSILGYYHAINSTGLAYLPLFPVGSHVTNRKHMNVTEFSPGGSEVCIMNQYHNPVS